MKKKIFDWEFYKTISSPERYTWMSQNHNKTISEEEFVKIMQYLKSFRRGKSYKYQPSHLKQEYKRLKENFGFFLTN